MDDSRGSRPGVPARIGPLLVVAGLLVSSAVAGPGDAAGLAAGLVLLVVTAAVHLLAHGRPGRHALEGLARVLTIVVFCALPLLVFAAYGSWGH